MPRSKWLSSRSPATAASAAIPPTPRISTAISTVSPGWNDQDELASQAATTPARNTNGTTLKTRSADRGNRASTLTRTRRKTAKTSGIAVWVRALSLSA